MAMFENMYKMKYIWVNREKKSLNLFLGQRLLNRSGSLIGQAKKYRESVANVYIMGFSDWLLIK